MRRFLIVCLACLMIFGLGLSASAKTLKLAMDADPVSLDPHVQLSGAMLHYSHLVFDPLVRWSKDMKIAPRLAVKWERKDPLTMRFFLRKGVKFHSGNDFTAHDVKWTLERLKVSPDFKGLFEPFTEAKVIDDHTVDLMTKKPYPLLLNMATYIFPMDRKFYTGKDKTGKPKDAIVKVGPSFALENESGSGPFYVVKRDPGVKWEMKRFADYWDKKSPGNVSDIILTPIKEDATRVAAILSGDVDFVMPVPPQDYSRIEKSKDLQLITMAGSRIITFQMNGERRPEFKNPKVRLAIVHATNNEGIAKKIMKGKATPAGQQAPKGFLGYVEELKPRFDLAKAKKLMKEAGFEKGFACTMIAPNNRYVNDEKIAQAFVAMVSKIGIKVDLKTMPKAQYWDEFDKRVADIQMIGWHPDTEDSANYTEYLLMCRDEKTGYGQYNSGLYCNKEVDDLLVKCQSETDIQKRAAMLKKIETILYNDAAYVPLHWQHLSWAAKKNLKNANDIVNVMNWPYLGDLAMD